MDISSTIKVVLTEMLDEKNVNISQDINNDTILLETGLDSLSFAILVIKLEEELGYDPFVLMKDPFYPRTYGEFIETYEKYKDYVK